MNKRQRETLENTFQRPAPITLEWRDIEALLLALGAKTVEGRGSRVRFELNGVVAAFHRPHPEKEAKPYQVRDARRFWNRQESNHEHDDLSRLCGTD